MSQDTGTSAEYRIAVLRWKKLRSAEANTDISATQCGRAGSDIPVSIVNAVCTPLGIDLCVSDFFLRPLIGQRSDDGSSATPDEFAGLIGCVYC